MFKALHKELNYGTVIYRQIYSDLGLPDFFKQAASKGIAFSLDAVIFAICYFNIEHKLNEPLDLNALDKRRSIFDFSTATAKNVAQALEIFKTLEPVFVPLINERTQHLIKSKSQAVKHSPNPKVVLKSLAYMIRCLFIKRVQDAGYKVPKEPLFTLLNEGTLLKRESPEVSPYRKVNKAFGIYGEEGKTLTVRKLMEIFGIDAAKPMRNYAELKAALKPDFPLNPQIAKETPHKLTEPEQAPADIDDKPATDHHVKQNTMDYIFAQRRIEKSLHDTAGTGRHGEES